LIELPFNEKVTAHISSPLVINVGDVMFDIIKEVEPISDRSDILNNLGLSAKNYALMTLHRAENVDDENRLAMLLKFVEEVEIEKVVFPVHPRTKKILSKIDIPKKIITIDPIGYIDMVKLTKESILVLTDSGGLQKEAFWLGVPCVTLREETEWIETIELGWNVLYKDYKGLNSFPKKIAYPFGDGRAGERIAQVLVSGEW